MMTLLALPFGLGTTEVLIIVLVALLLFGANRLPELGRSLGKTVTGFKDAMSGKEDQVESVPTSTAKVEPSKPVAPERLSSTAPTFENSPKV
jgi:sec-independent protein translocase protein TatA